MTKTFAKIYKILSLLGTGGMSEVYLAQDTKTGTKVAVKVLDKKLSKDKEYITRFSREIEISKSLSHENIIKIISYGSYKGSYYIVYEYIDGPTLDKYIKSKKLSISDIEDKTIQILSGLSYAHSKGIIHRDIKPSNIIISDKGIVKILDFGIAKASTKSTITKTGMFMGSPHYTSPEQIDGKKVDIRTDIYSLGIVLYEMVAGRVPFEADTPSGLAYKHVHEDAPHISTVVTNIPSYLSYIIFKSLEKLPKDRFSSAQEIIKILSIKSYPKKKVNNLKSYKNEKTYIIKKRSLLSVKIAGIISSAVLVAIVIISIFFIQNNTSKKEIVDNGLGIDSVEKGTIAIEETTEKEDEVFGEATESITEESKESSVNIEAVEDLSEEDEGSAIEQTEKEDEINSYRSDLNGYLNYKEGRTKQWEIFSEIENYIIDRMNKSNEEDLSIYKKLIINNTSEFLDYLYDEDVPLVVIKEHNAYIIYYEMHKRYWEYHLANYERSQLYQASLDFYLANIDYQNVKMEIIIEFNNKALSLGEELPFNDSDIEKIKENIKAANQKITEINSNN